MGSSSTPTWWDWIWSHAVLDYTAPDLYNQPQAPPLLKETASGRAIWESRAARGFYDWSKKSAEEVVARRDRFVLEFLRSRFGNGIRNAT